MEADLLDLEGKALHSEQKKRHSEYSNEIVYNFSEKGYPAVIQHKIKNLVKVLNQDIINMKKLKECLADGIPDETETLREYCWKIILGYLPPEKVKWKETIEKETKTYEGLISMFLPQQQFQGYPLMLKKNHPRYKQLQNDYLLWQQIEKDTSRTHAQFSFFVTPTPNIMLPYFTSARRQKFKLIYGDDEEAYQQFLNCKEKQRKTYRYDIMTRILYIYSKLNPKVQYVQGMNEILAPIFYLVNVGKPPHAIDEAACFFMFNNAISDTIDLHIKDLDKSQNGIYGKLNQVNQMLVVIEPLIWSRLQALKIDPFFYCFRWITLLYAQEFALFDTIRIWQSIFSAQSRIDFINFLAIAIIMSCKEVILHSQFTVILQNFQNIRDHLNIEKTIQIANELYLQFRDKDFRTHAHKSRKALKKKEEQRQRQMELQREIQEQVEEGNKLGAFFKRVGNMVDKFFD